MPVGTTNVGEVQQIQFVTFRPMKRKLKIWIYMQILTQD